MSKLRSGKKLEQQSTTIYNNIRSIITIFAKINAELKYKIFLRAASPNIKKKHELENTVNALAPCKLHTIKTTTKLCQTGRGFGNSWQLVPQVNSKFLANSYHGYEALSFFVSDMTS